MTTARAGSARWARSAGSSRGLLIAEASLVAVHLAVVVGFGRLYRGNEHLADLAAFTVGAHVLAVVARRLRLPTAAAVALGLVGAALVATWLLFPGTALFGLPTTTTFEAARLAVDEAGVEFRTVTAPTEPLAGFQLLAGLALWGAAWFADWAAFRLRVAAEALAPATILFVFCTVLGADDGRYAAAVLFAGTALFFVANHRALLAEHDNAWFATTPTEGARSVRRAAIGLGAVAVVIGAVVAPIGPGYRDDPLVRWRDATASGGVRTTVSPIVDLQRRLVSQSSRELFEVESPVEAYWRLTSLHDFDGQIWSSGGDFGVADEALSTVGPVVADTEVFTQQVRVKGLAAIWVPAAYQARILHETNRPVRWNADSSTLIVDASSPTSDGLTYRVTSARPVLDPGVLEAAVGVDPAEVTERYLDLPANFPSLATDEAQRAVAGATSRYQQARALQDHFQDGTFTYTTDIEAGHGNDALVTFLLERRGYCEQFAGAYAAMARSLGIPARVAVGFTPGERNPLDPTVFTVKGLHAHAWPEVYFPEVGWVPFEPTPGRGMPGAEPYTGLAPAQDAGGDPQATTTTVGTTTSVPGPDPSVPAPTTPDEVSASAPPADSDRRSGPGGAGVVGALVAAVVLLAIGALLAGPRLVRARRGAGDRPRAAIAHAWHDALTAVRWLTGLGPRASETHHEFARRAGPALHALAPGIATDLGTLADLAGRTAWDPAPPTPADAQVARDLAANLHLEARTRQSRAQRLRRRLSWREAFGRVRAGEPGAVG